MHMLSSEQESTVFFFKCQFQHLGTDSSMMVLNLETLFARTEPFEKKLIQKLIQNSPLISA